MATRAVRANSSEHVQALNSIDLFFNKNNRKQKPVIDAWSVYFDHLHDLSDTAAPEEIKRWHVEAVKLLVDLLSKLSTYLGYDFDLVQLKRGIYFPRSQETELTEQALMRQNLLKVLRGEQPIKVSVTAFPFPNVSGESHS